ncbi:MAG: penicillin-binding protein 2 [Chloroflexi bacterium]|nr:penicillin-binding protein 2 [Chloroflexota bacterium]
MAHWAVIDQPINPPPPPPPNDVEARSWRLYALHAIITGCLIVLVAKLFYIQIYRHDHYRALAAKEHWRREIVPAVRGALRDRAGQPLVMDVPFESVYANAAQITDPARVAAALAPVIGEPAAAIEEKLRARSPAPTLLKRQVPADIADRIRSLRLWDISLRPEPSRGHPEGDLAAAVLGVVGADRKGLSGIELAFDRELAGQPGSVVAERDTGGDEIAFGPRESEAPVNGADVVLTIDRFIQHIAERELAGAMERHQAAGGTIVVLDPRTGAVLAIASRPTFRFDDPNLFAATSVSRFRIPAIQDLYEPGSTFKVITMGAALDAQAVTPDTTFQNQGSLSYGGGIVRNAVWRPPGPETMTQTLQRSSNIGAAFAATKLGSERFYQYVMSFGFGRPAGIDLPGEAAGLLRVPGGPDWYPFDLAVNAFGQGISVTPLQLAAAVAAVANGGTLMKPYVVREVIGPAERRTYSPTIVRQVIRADTARTLTQMLVATVETVDGGQVRLSRLPGYRLAGKTGTAEIPTRQGYTTQATIASFVGFGPADSPRFVILVKIDEPKDTPWGETVAAPIFRTLARELMLYYRVPPQTEPPM